MRPRSIGAVLLTFVVVSAVGAGEAGGQPFTLPGEACVASDVCFPSGAMAEGVVLTPWGFEFKVPGIEDPWDMAACCGASKTSGEGVCRDLWNDPEHCGSCGNACLRGQICAAGECRPCGLGRGDCGDRTCCAGVCTDVDSDESNCGACGIECAPGDTCCAEGVTHPSRRRGCFDLQSSEAHCGGCGKACGADEQCESGACLGTLDKPCAAQGCIGDLTCCSGSCRDLENDADNCMACGVSVDTDTDFYNCGECGKACGADEQCESGACLGTLDQPCTAQGCVGDLTCCSGFCKDLENDADNCLQCGASVDTDTDVDHCGGCGDACGASADDCVGGTCVCGSGPACGPGGTCSAGQCACDENADCPNEQVCNRSTNTCEFAGCFMNNVGEYWGCIVIQAPYYADCYGYDGGNHDNDGNGPQYDVSCLRQSWLTSAGAAVVDAMQAQGQAAGPNGELVNGLCVDRCNDGAHCGIVDHMLNSTRNCFAGNACCPITLGSGEYAPGEDPTDPGALQCPPGKTCPFVWGVPNPSPTTCDAGWRSCEQ